MPNNGFSFGDKDFSALLVSCLPMMRRKAKRYKLYADADDLIQEGAISLYQAYMNFDETKDVPFLAYANICISNAMISLVRANTKHVVNIDFEAENNYIKIQTANNPEKTLLEKEEFLSFKNMINSLLSDYEKQVFTHYINGQSYSEIAKKVSRSEKSVDNAISRIKNKIKNMPKIA